MGWVLRSRARGLANILDAGICCQSCKKSSTESKYASGGATRVACCELSQSLLDLSPSKRGIKLGWVVRSRARGLSHISDAGICCQSCRKSSTESKYASGGASRVACCELSQSLFDLSRSKRGMKLGWVLRSRARGLQTSCWHFLPNARNHQQNPNMHLVVLPGRLAVLSQSLIVLSREKGDEVGVGPQIRGLSHILECQSCKKSSTESKYAAGATRVACCELSQSLIDLSRSKRGMKLGWVVRSQGQRFVTHLRCMAFVARVARKCQQNPNMHLVVLPGCLAVSCLNR